MKKVLVSILALAMMLSCFCTINVFADEVTPTITAKNAAGEVVGTTYTSISSAASAAGENGKVILSAGTFEFNGRQGISVNGITLEGADKNTTFIKTSDTFKDGSETNRKALLTIAANNVTVKDLTIDGSVYGDTITANTDFVVLRCNSGTDIELDNILVKGSKKTLIQIGTSSASAEVTGTDLYCEAYNKGIPQKLDIGYSKVYADIDVNDNSYFYLMSGAVDGFIYASDEDSLYNGTSNHYRLTRSILIFDIVDVMTTTKHFVGSYHYVKGDPSLDDYKANFVTLVNNNTSIIRAMTDEALIVRDSVVVSNFIELLNDALSTSYNATIEQCRNDLLGIQQGVTE